jgi:hypothetical protein
MSSASEDSSTLLPTRAINPLTRALNHNEQMQVIWHASRGKARNIVNSYHGRLDASLRPSRMQLMLLKIGGASGMAIIPFQAHLKTNYLGSTST